MKLLKRIFGRRKKAYWQIYNPFETIEFAECSNCGYEIEPDFTYFPHSIYPTVCPKCNARMKYSQVV